MVANIQINKSIGYTIDFAQYEDMLKQSTSQNISYLKKMDRRYTIVARSTGGHFKINDRKESVSLSEILATLINGHNDNLLKGELCVKCPFVEQLLQTTYHYYY